MAEEVKAPVVADATKATEEPTRSTEAPSDNAVVEAKPADGGDMATSGEVAKGSKEDSPKEATATEPTVADTSAHTENAEDTTAAAPAADTAATNGTPASSKKANNNRRKSGASVPEHNKKKTPSKKKEPAKLRLDVQPGEVYFVAMKGYQPWPVIVCDENMLPETLLSKRPVSARRIDGTYREDFMEGGKNAKDRRYPVMFMGTNEFAWEVNTNLQDLDVDTVKAEVEKGNNQKKSKALWEAYTIAAEGHDLQWFKEMLEAHEQALAVDAEEKAAAETKKQEKKDKAKRKSTAAEESEDVEMEDAGEEGKTPGGKKKTSKKRKAESDGEPEKPAKTPKTKLKLTNNAPKDASAAKPKETKPKKAKAKSESTEAEAAKVEEKPLTEAEKREKQEKSVLYLRHRLQKGFLARDQAPKEEEMANMSDYLKQLEEYTNLEAEIIRKTKVHKVLKAIVKLQSIPKEDEYQFKKRSHDLLNNWSGALAAEEPAGETSAPAATAPAVPTTNGVNHAEEEKDSTTVKAAEASSTVAATATDGDGDVSMADTKETPVVKADADPNAAVATEGVAEVAAA